LSSGSSSGSSLISQILVPVGLASILLASMAFAAPAGRRSHRAVPVRRREPERRPHDAE
jgi:hypothetical protein